MIDKTYEEELPEVEEMIATKAIPLINKLIKDKKFGAKLTGTSTDNNFLYIGLQIVTRTNVKTVEVDITLGKQILFSRGCCDELDKWANIKDKKYDIALSMVVLIRILRVVFQVCQSIGNGWIEGNFENGKYVKEVSFNDKSGALWYH